VPGALAAAQLLGMKLHRWELRSADELEGTFAMMIKERPDALLVLPYPRTYAHARRIVQLAEEHQLPAVYPFREAVEAGDSWAMGRMPRTCSAAPAFEQPTKFEFVVNLKTAKALGLTIPPSLLLRADQAIE